MKKIYRFFLLEFTQIIAFFAGLVKKKTGNLHIVKKCKTQQITGSGKDKAYKEKYMFNLGKLGRLFSADKNAAALLR